MLLCLLSWSCWKQHTPQTVQNNCRAEDLYCLYEDFFFINIGGSNLDSMGEVELLRNSVHWFSKQYCKEIYKLVEQVTG